MQKYTKMSTESDNELKEVIIRYRKAVVSDFAVELFTCYSYIKNYCYDKNHKRTYFKCNTVEVKKDGDKWNVFYCPSCEEISLEDAVEDPKNPLLFNHKLDCPHLGSVPLQ